jgi:hypothetical protein
MPDRPAPPLTPGRRRLFTGVAAIGVAVAALGMVAASSPPSAESGSCVVAHRTANPLVILSVMRRVDPRPECDPPDLAGSR